MALCSIAIAAGIVGVVAVVKRLVFRRRFGHLAFGGGPCGGGAGGYGFGGEGDGPSCGGRGRGLGFGFGGTPWARFRTWGGRGGGIGRSFWLRALFTRLDTTPGQEREIRAALEELRERVRDARTGLPEARANIGKAIAGDTFDASAFEAVSARFDATAEKMKDAASGALEQIHAVLDPKQRERLAAIVSKGGFGPWERGGREGGPYRGGAEG